MAVTLQRINVRVDFGSIVDNAITSVRNVRFTEQARKESEFQKAVAGGMSYQSQLEFRKEQLEDEKTSSISDPTYISSLEKSIENTKKLARFETIRTKYKQSLDDYVGGKASVAQHLSILQETFDTEQDPDMKKEIRDLISESRSEQSKIELNAIKNRALVAGKDRSISLVDASVDEVTNRRSRAAINKNDDEVAMWDDTLLALRSAKGKIQVENGLNEISFQTNKYGLKATEKMNLLNGYITSADAATPVTYDGVSYPSIKAYWENKRGEYINTGFMDEVKKELDSQTKSLASSSQFGQIPVARINAVNEFYNTLKSRAEFIPFAEKVEQYRADTVSSMVNDLAESIYSEAGATGDQGKAQAAILAVENKFGIKVSREPFAVESEAGKGIATGAIQAVSEIGKAAEPTTPTTPKEGTRIVKEGDSLSRIAAESGVSLNTLLDNNPQFKTNPNAIRPGQVVNLPKVEVAPVTVAPTQPTTPTQVAPTPAAPITPTEPIKPTTQVVPQEQPVTPVAQRTIVVKPGESLSSIAQRELGDASRAFELKSEGGQTYDEKTAKSLQIGTKLTLPS